MNWTKLIVAGLIGGVVYFFLGWGVYGMALADVLSLPADIKAVIEYPQEEFKMGMMILSCIAWGMLLSFVLSKIGSSTWQTGAITSAIIAALVSLSVGAGQAAMWRFGSLNNTFIDMLANAFCSGISGAAVAWYLGRQ